MRKLKTVHAIKTLFMVLLALSSSFSGCICDNDLPVQSFTQEVQKSKLLISTDAGETWTLKQTSTNSKLLRLSYAYSTYGYRIVASGEDGTVLITTNNGGTFSTAGPFTGFDFNGAGFSAEDGRIILSNGDISVVASTDGGETWLIKQTGNLHISYIDVNPALPLFQAACSISDPTHIYISTNGGNNWLIKSADAANGDDFAGIKFVRGNIIIAYGSNGLMLRSTNYGENWSRVSLPVNDRIQSAATNLEWQTIISNTNRQGKFLKSTDLGITWEMKDFPITTSYSPQVFAMSYSGELMGAGYKGSLFKSTDMGDTWREINSGTGANINDVIYINNSLVAAIAY